MGYREVRIVDVKEVIRRWQEGQGVRRIKAGTGLSRKTVRRYIEAAVELGVERGGPAPTEEQLAELVARFQPGRRPAQDGAAARLGKFQERIRHWLEEEELQLTRVYELLTEQEKDVDISYATLWRVVRSWGLAGRRKITVRREPCKAGELAEVDFGRMGLLWDEHKQRRRWAWAFVMTLGYSRHQFLAFTFDQRLETVIQLFEQGFRFLEGVPQRLVVDSIKAIVELADNYDPRFNRSFLEFAEHYGFIPDPARIGRAQDKPTVEAGVRFARERFWKGRALRDLAHANREGRKWCLEVAGLRVHGTTRRQPLLVFRDEEKAALRPLPTWPYDIAHWGRCKVHRDHHIQFQKALYGMPTAYIGREVDVRGDSQFVRIYHHGRLIRTHPRKPPGGKSTHPDDYPKEKTPYAMRDINWYIKQGRTVGPQTGTFLERLLDGPVPWSHIRQAQKCLRLAEKYGAQRMEAACERALAFELLNVRRLESILEQALVLEARNGSAPQQPALPGGFLRAPGEFAHPSGGGNGHGKPS